MKPIETPSANEQFRLQNEPLLIFFTFRWEFFLFAGAATAAGAFSGERSSAGGDEVVGRNLATNEAAVVQPTNSTNCLGRQ